MVRIRQQILQIAPVDVPVFICGESGVGKEVVSRMIHLRSKRRNQPFVKVNCAALPGELLESELFGFEQGAFTGAVRSKPGKFELANKGTIFLDEIAEMSTHLQAKLLHVLQDHQYSRLGGRHLVETDVRVLAATNVDVQEAMKTGRFREDLYYRLNVLSILVPPLRERTAEIPLLFRHFLEKYSEHYGKKPSMFSEYAVTRMMEYAWPGNIRELENMVKRYVIVGNETQIIRELSTHKPIVRSESGPMPIQGKAGRSAAEVAGKMYRELYDHSFFAGPGHIWVPIDDEHTLVHSVTWSVKDPIPPEAREMTSREEGNPGAGPMRPLPSAAYSRR